MATILKIYTKLNFSLKPKDQLTQNLSGNQVSDTGPSWPSCIILACMVTVMKIGTDEFAQSILILKAPVTTAADDNFLYIFFFIFQRKHLDISCESIHMKCQDLFSLKNNKKKN